jgi:uncharacterized OB-fold protein
LNGENVTTDAMDEALGDHYERFWKATAAGRLIMQQCEDCWRWQHPPSVRCIRCGGGRVAFRRVSGRGTVYSFATVTRVVNDDYPDVPYVVVLVELDDAPGARIFSRVISDVASPLAIGQVVEVQFESRGGRVLPLFQCARDAQLSGGAERAKAQ